jgi:hypothetical protein
MQGSFWRTWATPSGLTTPDAAKQPPDLVAKGGAGLALTLPDAVQGLHRLVVNRCDRDEPHAVATHGFTEGLGIVGSIVVAFDRGLHKLRTDALHGVPQLRQLAGPRVGTAWGFSANEAGRQPSEKGQDRVPHAPLCEDDRAVDVHAVELKEMLGRVDTQRRNLLHGGLSYDWQHGLLPLP